MEKNLDKHIDRIVEVMNSIELGGTITVLTGSNGSGKSLIRKQILFSIANKLGLDTSDKNNLKGLAVSTSMERRTIPNNDFSALRSMAIDDPTSPTSAHTVHLIKSLMGSCKGQFIIIDEPEIGMGEETVLGLVAWLNATLKDTVRSNEATGVLIITHSRLIVEKLEADAFLNIDGYTKDGWLNRELVPLDLEELERHSLELYRAINKRSKEK